MLTEKVVILTSEKEQVEKNAKKNSQIAEQKIEGLESHIEEMQ